MAKGGYRGGFPGGGNQMNMIKQAQKIKLVENTVHKIRQKGGEVPEEVAYEMEYLQM